ncbi:Aerobic cobaltochelatase subunit CobT [Vibrio mediterranei]|uniref:Cobalamin biosynthesis protein CobT n=1 Tax=Vibrio mediterranei TaxID=689 RepID=A0ABX5DEP6_9VIBR|nr:cobalamin biosynthesis protein CobT [Vibrio mediterranei]PCD86518.1 cobalamin biosynthesis protein CobT [Vibrio mediterranei]PRQ66935.1 cobalamin biosynthesis protein CobT [Vibrio mediterranei]SBO08977.1 Aerobic cobaltochelatase subunit CobT [Vibrio mediterranei]
MANVSSRQKKILDLSVSVARAISGDATLNYRGERLYKGDQPCYFLSAHANDLTFVSRHELTKSKLAMQGKIDSSAFRLLISDAELHYSLRPSHEVERLLFDFCEQVRIESQIPHYLAGIQTSTRFNFSYWSEQYHQNGFTESRLGMLLFTLMQVIYTRMIGMPVSEPIAEAIESTRAGIVPIIGTCLVQLKKHRCDQQLYAAYAKELAALASELIKQEQEQSNNQPTPTVEEDIKILAQLALIVDGDIEDHDVEADITGNSKAFQLAGANYQVFSREFDREVRGDTLVRRALLLDLRQKLTDDMMARQVNTRRLAAILSSIVQTPQHNKRQDHLEEGVVNADTLTKLVTSPLERSIFSQPELGISHQCAITFLMDCSGSMQKHSHKMSLLMDTLLKSVGLADIPFEILGFTTGNWNGGRVYRQWLQQGQPKHPGRLNELRHIVFKDFETHWRRARLGIASLRKADIFKEGIDGEAVQFATQRLTSQGAQRKILIIFSDGCPMDTATSTANDQFYLDNHLKQTIERESHRNNIEIYGVGMGIDLSPYYRNNITLDVQESCLFSLCREVFGMLRKYAS